MRRKSKRFWRKGETTLPRAVGYGSLMLLGLIVLTLIFPVVGSSASADEPSTDSVMSTSVNTNLTTLVRSSIAVALSSRVDLDVTPKSTGAFSTSSADLKVTTNNTTGYAVYLQTADNSSELKATNPHIEANIGPVEGTMSEGSYASTLNQWGYAISGSNTATSGMEYKAVPQAGDEAIVRTTGISREDDYDLSFAVAVGSDLPAGLYTNQLLVSVVANPIEVRSLNDITYMQDMTAEICAITFEGETKQLVDSRDGKSYWVAKLKDGNCWMTENLGLTAPEGGRELAPNDSDVAESWTLPETITELGISTPEEDSDIAVYSLNLGDNSGTYFTYLAAITQTTEFSGGIAMHSLCPRGWKLPLAGEDYNNTSGSFYNLLNAYGLSTRTTSIAGEYEVYTPSGKKNVTVSNGQFSINKEPLNFSTNGIVNASNGTINYNGISGEYWSAVRFDDNSSRPLAYSLSFDTTNGSVTPSYNNAWFNRSRFGKPIRCVAR